MIYQRTLAKEVKVTGIGLHSGKKVTLKLYLLSYLVMAICRPDSAVSFAWPLSSIL